MSFLSAIGVRPKASVIQQEQSAASSRLLQRLEQGAFSDAERVLGAVTDAYRYRIIDDFAERPNSVPLAANWVAASPDSALANVLLGASYIATGWAVRGGGYAGGVTSEQWDVFLEYLGNAKAPLLAASELDPQSADAYSWLIQAAMAGGGSRAYLADLFLEALAREPLHWASHYAFFDATKRKWGGSHREMFQFAQEASNKAPRGSILHSLLPGAYCDFVLAEGEEGEKRIHATQHAQRVVLALYAWLDATPATLSERLAQAGGPYADSALNDFAVACYLCGANKEAYRIMKTLNGEILRAPWSWVARSSRERQNPAFVYDRMLSELTARLKR